MATMRDASDTPADPASADRNDRASACRPDTGDGSAAAAMAASRTATTAASKLSTRVSDVASGWAAEPRPGVAGRKNDVAPAAGATGSTRSTSTTTLPDGPALAAAATTLLPETTGQARSDPLAGTTENASVALMAAAVPAAAGL